MIDVDIRNDDALSAHHEFFDILGGIVVFKGFWDLLGRQAASTANMLFSFSLLLFPYYCGDRHPGLCYRETFTVSHIPYGIQVSHCYTPAGPPPPGCGAGAAPLVSLKTMCYLDHLIR